MAHHETWIEAAANLKAWYLVWPMIKALVKYYTNPKKS